MRGAARIACAGLAALAFAAASPEAARGAGGPPADVAALQVALRADGLYAGPVDGIEGPGTLAAIRALQSRAGIAVDGIAGPATRAALWRPAWAPPMAGSH